MKNIAISISMSTRGIKALRQRGNEEIQEPYCLLPLLVAFLPPCLVAFSYIFAAFR
jgi:hypothetical protein